MLKSTRFIFESYSKYTKYTEGEILDHLAIQLLKEDREFVKSISKQRTNKSSSNMVYCNTCQKNKNNYLNHTQRRKH